MRQNAALFFGPPGTGKSTLARLLLERVDMRPIWFGTAPELSRRYVGETEKELKTLFDKALTTPNLQCCVVIDDIDTLTARRTASQSEQHTDWPSLMLRLVGSDDPNLLVIGTTNRKNAIDPAFLRPGRMQLQFFCGRLPMEAGLQVVRETCWIGFRQAAERTGASLPGCNDELHRSIVEDGARNSEASHPSWQWIQNRCSDFQGCACGCRICSCQGSRSRCLALITRYQRSSVKWMKRSN